MKKIDNLKWVPCWVSHLGCIKGCLNYLNHDITDAWLYGATGHAFILNVKPDLCPSGPTDWNSEKIIKLGENIGYETESVERIWSIFYKKPRTVWLIKNWILCLKNP